MEVEENANKVNGIPIEVNGDIDKVEKEVDLTITEDSAQTVGDTPIISKASPPPPEPVSVPSTLSNFTKTNSQESAKVIRGLKLRMKIKYKFLSIY